MLLPPPLPRTNDYRTFAKKLSRIAHTVQMHSDELSSLVAVDKRRSLTEWEVKRYLALNGKLDWYDEMFSWDIPYLQETMPAALSSNA